MNCHTFACPPTSYTVDSCACGFTAGMLRGEFSPTNGPQRGQGGGERYVAKLDPPPSSLCAPLDLEPALAALRERSKTVVYVDDPEAPAYGPVIVRQLGRLTQADARFRLVGP